MEVVGINVPGPGLLNPLLAMSHMVRQSIRPGIGSHVGYSTYHFHAVKTGTSQAALRPYRIFPKA